MSILTEAFDRYINTQDKQFDDRYSTVGSSEIGKCARQIFWVKNADDDNLKVSRDPDYNDRAGARTRGNLIEKLLVQALRQQFPGRLRFAGHHQRTISNNWLSATPDGLLVRLTDDEVISIIGRERFDRYGNGPILTEIKTHDPRMNLSEEKMEHRYQVQCAMGVMRDTTQYKPDCAVLIYIDASFLELKTFIVEFDEEVYGNALLRARQIMTSKDVNEMPPEGWISGGHECRWCPYTHACGIERRSLPFAEDDKPIDPQLVAEITDLARAIKSHEHDRDYSDELMRAAQEELKNRLREKGIRKVPGVLTWSTVKGRSGYDNKAIKEAAIAAGIDIEQFATQGEPSDRLTLLIGNGRDDHPVSNA